jgi:hypothetical protein
MITMDSLSRNLQDLFTRRDKILLKEIRTDKRLDLEIGDSALDTDKSPSTEMGCQWLTFKVLVRCYIGS